MNWPEDRKEIFLRVAELFGVPYSERSKRNKRLSHNGICYAVGELIVPRTKFYAWLDQFETDYGLLFHQYWWPPRNHSNWTPSCDSERATFCCFMATLSDEEFREIS